MIPTYIYSSLCVQTPPTSGVDYDELQLPSAPQETATNSPRRKPQPNSPSFQPRHKLDFKMASDLTQEEQLELQRLEEIHRARQRRLPPRFREPFTPLSRSSNPNTSGGINSSTSSTWRRQYSLPPPPAGYRQEPAPRATGQSRRLPSIQEQLYALTTEEKTALPSMNPPNTSTARKPLPFCHPESKAPEPPLPFGPPNKPEQFRPRNDVGSDAENPPMAGPAPPTSFPSSAAMDIQPQAQFPFRNRAHNPLPTLRARAANSKPGANDLGFSKVHLKSKNQFRKEMDYDPELPGGIQMEWFM